MPPATLSPDILDAIRAELRQDFPGAEEADLITPEDLEAIPEQFARNGSPERYQQAVKSKPNQPSLFPEAEGASHWTTIGGHPSGGKKHAGGTAIEVSGAGEILKGGPKELRGTKIEDAKTTLDSIKRPDPAKLKESIRGHLGQHGKTHYHDLAALHGLQGHETATRPNHVFNQSLRELRDAGDIQEHASPAGPHAPPSFSLAKSLFNPSGQKQTPKEIIKAMPAPDHLPEKHGDYFTMPPGTMILPLDKLEPIRARPDGIENAGKYMAAAAEGLTDKRKPISVQKQPDGTYKVLDGNSTYANAKQFGWESIPAMETLPPDAGHVAAPGQGTEGPAKMPEKPVPGEVYKVPTGELEVDPYTFQYKLGTDKKKGVTEELKGVKKWNKDLAGVLLAWKDPMTGRVYVVNGHHRHELAGRMGQPDLDVRFIDAPDAKTARGKGALANIAEGRGTAVDAAKFMRDTGLDEEALSKQGISLKGAVARDASALKTLSDSAFDKVVQERLPIEQALAVAAHLQDPERQDKLFRILANRQEQPSNAAIVRMAKSMKLAGTAMKDGGLFGAEDEDTFVERGQIEAAMESALRKEMTDYEALANKARAKRVEGSGNVLDIEANAAKAKDAAREFNTFDILAGLKGQLSDVMNDFAGKLAGAKSDAERQKIYADAITAGRGAMERERSGQAVSAPERAAAPGVGGGTAPGGGDRQAAPRQAAAPGASQQQPDKPGLGLKQEPSNVRQPLPSDQAADETRAPQAPGPQAAGLDATAPHALPSHVKPASLRAQEGPKKKLADMNRAELDAEAKRVSSTGRKKSQPKPPDQTAPKAPVSAGAQPKTSDKPKVSNEPAAKPSGHSGPSDAPRHAGASAPTSSQGSAATPAPTPRPIPPVQQPRPAAPVPPGKSGPAPAAPSQPGWSPGISGEHVRNWSRGSVKAGIEGQLTPEQKADVAAAHREHWMKGTHQDKLAEGLKQKWQQNAPKAPPADQKTAWPAAEPIQPKQPLTPAQRHELHAEHELFQEAHKNALDLHKAGKTDIAHVYALADRLNTARKKLRDEGLLKPQKQPSAIFTPEEQGQSGDVRQPIPAHASYQDLARVGEVANTHLKKLLDEGQGLDKALGYTAMQPPYPGAPEHVKEAHGERVKQELSQKGGLVMLANIKGEKRAMEKAHHDYDGDLGQLRDIARATVAVDSVDDIGKTMGYLRSKGMQIVGQPKDRMANPTEEGYRDLLFNVRMPNGVISEVQVHLKPMTLAKEEGHKHYEKTRTIMGDMRKQRRIRMTPQEAAEFNKAFDTQTKLYNAAWQKIRSGTSPAA